jgi:hypothetical protein
MAKPCSEAGRTAYTRGTRSPIAARTSTSVLPMWLSEFCPVSALVKDLYNFTSDDAVITIAILVYGALFATGLCWLWFEKE